MVDAVQHLLLHHLVHVGEVHEDPRPGIRLSPQHHLEPVIVAVQIEALALVPGEPVCGGKRELGLDLMHGALL